LLDAFEQDGCPVCTLIQRNVLRYLDMLIHENVNDIDFRDELRRAGGFCNRHAWLFVTTARGAAVGAAIMYRDLLNAYRQTLRQATISNRGPGLPWRRKTLVALGAHGTLSRDPACPACEIAERDGAIFVGAFAAHCDAWQFVEAYTASNGLCRPHFEVALSRCPGSRAAEALLDAQGKILTRVIDDLDRFLEKSDYRISEEPTALEARSWQRAIELATGKNGVP
jgi:hypothetical protein